MQNSVFLDIRSWTWSLLADFRVPLLDGEQSPPLSDHQYQRNRGRRDLYDIEAIRALRNPIIVPTKSSVNISTNGCFVHIPAWNDWIQEVGRQRCDGVYEGEGHE